MEQAVPDLLVVGATGRLGGFLRAVWGDAGPPGLPVVWQTRAASAPPGWLCWRPGMDHSGMDHPAMAHPAMTLPPAQAVLVLAGVTSGDADALAANADIALAVCVAATKAGVGRVMLASSAAIYGAADGADETRNPAPRTPYGTAKLTMERVCLDWQARHGGPEVTALRIGNVVGADLLGRMVARGGRVRLDRFADGTGPVRSYIGPATFARVIAALATQTAPLPPVLNLAAPGAVAMADLLAAAGVGHDWHPAPPSALPRAVMDTGLLRSMVPFAPDDCTASGMVAQWHRLKGPA